MGTKIRKFLKKDIIDALESSNAPSSSNSVAVTSDLEGLIQDSAIVTFENLTEATDINTNGWGYLSPNISSNFATSNPDLFEADDNCGIRYKGDVGDWLQFHVNISAEAVTDTGIDKFKHNLAITTPTNAIIVTPGLASQFMINFEVSGTNKVYESSLVYITRINVSAAYYIFRSIFVALNNRRDVLVTSYQFSITKFK